MKRLFFVFVFFLGLTSLAAVEENREELNLSEWEVAEVEVDEDQKPPKKLYGDLPPGYQVPEEDELVTKTE